VLSGVYLLFLLLAGKRVFLLFLKPFKATVENQMDSNITSDPYREMLAKPNRMGLLKILGASALIFAFAGGLGQLVPQSLMMVTVILLITTLGMLGSAVPALRKTPYSFELGMYLILVFSVTVSSMVNINDMIHASPQLILYITLVVFGSLLLHVVLARIFKIDADTVLITSTALICSPPFVPVVAASIRNKSLIIPGLSVGIIGYAVGNYLGFIVAEILHWIS